jgi:hypothetical protein
MRPELREQRAVEKELAQLKDMPNVKVLGRIPPSDAHLFTFHGPTQRREK